jgi:hypothetical protein
MPGCTSLSEIYELPDARFFAFAERLYNNHKFWRDAEESFKVPEVCQISSLMLQIRFNPRAMTPKELHEQLSGFTLESLRERLGNHFVDPA